MTTVINLPQLNSLDDRLDPPLGLMYIAGILEANNIPVKIVDLAFFDRSKWNSAIGYADTYGITVFSASLYLAKEVYEICKKINPKCKVVVGGPHPTSLPYETMGMFDCVVVGEGEYAFFEELDKVVRMPLILDLNKLPMPARHLIDIRAYTRKVFGGKATSLMTSRGCPYNCAFCCKDVFGSKVRNFSVDRVLKEIEQIRSYGIRHLIFYDDTFTLNRDRLYKLCMELGRLNVIFRCNGDTRTNTRDDFRTLYNAGCREICFGIESGSQKILDKVNKKATVEQNIEAIKNAKRAGLLAKAFLMIGSPGETKETIEETKRFILEAGPDQFSLFTFVPLPGCDIWKHPSKYGMKIVSKDFKNYYNLAGDYEGGIVAETKDLSIADIKELKEDLLSFLRLKGQRGDLQDYYART